MSNENEILTIAGKRVRVAYTDGEVGCFANCCLYAECSRIAGLLCKGYSLTGYFVPAEETETDNTAQAQLVPSDIEHEAALTCRNCAHRERWQMGGSVIQYCGARRSSRTQNGLHKIKVTDKACALYKEEKK